MLKFSMAFLSDVMPKEQTFREYVSSVLKKALQKLNVSEDVASKLEVSYPKHRKFGEYTTNIALLLAKELRKSPVEIANEIARISKDLDSTGYIANIEVVVPGFINVYVDFKKIWEDLLNGSGAFENLLYFCKKEKNKDSKVIVEHTSVNPNKALHVGHLRNAVLGDTIARLLKNIFKNVEIQNYIDDTGLQVADTTAALKLYGDTPGGIQFDDYCWDIYARFHRELKDEALAEDRKRLREQILKQIEEHSGEYYEFSQKVVHKILDYHLNELAGLNIRYDLLIHERDIIAFKLWDYAFELLKKAGKLKYFEEGKYAGCWVFISENMPPKILVRSNGTKVYTAKDIAYHLWKLGALDFDFLYKAWKGEIYKDENLYQTDEHGKEMPNRFGHGDKVINVIDYRQAYPQQVVKEALEEVLNKKDVMYHLAYGVVNLSKKTAALLGVDTSDGKEVYAMSGRKGIGVKAKDMYKKVYEAIEKKVKDTYGDTSGASIDIHAITVAAIRYQLIKYTAERDIVFDIDEATQFVGKTGPYLQYSYVRGLNILRKYTGKEEIDLPTLKREIYEAISELSEQGASEYQLDSHEKDLLYSILKFKEAVYEALTLLEPAVFAEYSYELASAFNSFYEHSPILSEKNDLAKLNRILLVIVFLQTLEKVLDILGIDRISRM